MGEFYDMFFNEDEDEETINDDLFSDFLSDPPAPPEDDFLFTQIDGMDMTPADQFITDNDIDAETLALFEAAKVNAAEQLATIEADKKAGKAIKAIIDGIEIIKRAVEEEVVETIEKAPLPKVRTFKDSNRGHKEEVIYKDAVIENKSKKGVLIFFLIIGVVASTYAGIVSNSYHNYDSSVSAAECLWFGLVMAEASGTNVPFTMLPFETGIFIPCFLITFTIIEAFGLVAWTNAEERQKARDGHEHGNAKLMTDSGMRKYIRNFMQ